jgi:hypothetical protein
VPAVHCESELHEPGPPEPDELPPKEQVPFGGVVAHAASLVRWFTGTLPPLDEPPDELLEPPLDPPLELLEPLLDPLPELLLDAPLLEPPPEDEPLLLPLEPPLEPSLPASVTLNATPPHAHTATSPAIASRPLLILAALATCKPPAARANGATNTWRGPVAAAPRCATPDRWVSPDVSRAGATSGVPRVAREAHPIALFAFFSFFFFCFSLVESFGLLSLRDFSIPLAMAYPSVGSPETTTHTRAFVRAEAR